MLYESYNIRKNSPTVGLFFFAEDYMIFLKHLKEFLKTDLKFIEPNNSKWKDYPELQNDKRFGNFPIGILQNEFGTVEIFFLHYSDNKSAYDKWTKRCARVNFNKLLIKFDDQNQFDEKYLCDFSELTYKNKIFFTCNKNIYSRGKKILSSENIFFVHQPKYYKTVTTSHLPYFDTRKVKITNILNNL